MELNAKEKMDQAIWEHGRKKAYCTEAITKLKKIDSLKNHPVILEAIELIKKEKERLSNESAFD